MTRCLVADDHPAMVEAVCEVLAEHGIEVAGRARDGDEALTKIQARKPDVAVVDLRMPRLSGVEIARRAASFEPRDRGHPLHRVRGAGASHGGARRGRTRLRPQGGAARRPRPRRRDRREPAARASTPSWPGSSASTSAEDVPSLTQRERDVLGLLADGLSNEEIGKRLFISPRDCAEHIRKAMDQLDADTRTQAVAKALRQSLIA